MQWELKMLHAEGCQNSSQQFTEKIESGGGEAIGSKKEVVEGKQKLADSDSAAAAAVHSLEDDEDEAAAATAKWGGRRPRDKQQKKKKKSKKVRKKWSHRAAVTNTNCKLKDET